jgi:hypothetical protein
MELPSEETLRWIVARYAHLRAAHGAAIGTPQLLEPTGEFFPDVFSATPEGVATLFRRTLSYAPVADDLDFELAFAAPEEKDGGGGCSSGACSPGEKEGGLALGNAFELDDGGYRVVVRVTDVGNPLLLTSSLARSAGSVVLFEAGEELADGEQGALSEIAATAIGYGAILLSGACVYMKSCGGLRAQVGTHLDVSELSVALALFLRVHGLKPGAARAHLETTQREAFDEALRWVDSNPALVAALQAHPETLTDGIFELSEAKGILGRLFAKKAVVAPPTAAELRSSRAPSTRSEAERARLAEMKALVEESLRAR